MSATEVVANMPLHSATVRVNKHKADWRGWKFMWPFALVFVFVFVIPILYAIYISFFQKQMIGGTKFVGISNYIRLFHDQQFWSSVGRVALFTCVQVPIMLFLSAAMALALDSMKLHGAKFFRISTFLPYAVPAVVSTLVWGFMYARIRPGRLAERLAGHEPRRAEPKRAARFDRQHRDVGVHGLQHADLLQLAVHDPAFAVRGRLDRRGVRVADRQVHQAAGTEGLARDHGDLLDHRSFQLFNEPSILQNMVPGNAITTYYTPNMYAYNLSFAGQPVELRRRPGDHDGRDHDGDRVRGAAQQHEGADEVRPVARTIRI